MEMKDFLPEISGLPRQVSLYTAIANCICYTDVNKYIHVPQSPSGIHRDMQWFYQSHNVTGYHTASM